MPCCHPSHKLPTLPLRFNGWRGSTFFPAPPDYTGQCQLHVTATAAFALTGFGGSVVTFARYLYLAKGTDIRSNEVGTSPDLIEVPPNTGRLYRVYSVDDIAKGFTNEFRIALILPTGAPFGFGRPVWPNPYP